MDDSGGVLGEIGSAVATVAGAVGDELKKFGQSATSQVSGGSNSGQTSRDTSAVDQLAGFGKSITAQITGSSASGDNLQSQKSGKKADLSVLGELSNFAKSAASQVSEGKVLEEMKASDAEFSEREAGVVRAKIARVYEEHNAKRKQEERVKKQQEVQVEAQKKQVEQFKKTEQNDEVNPAVAKSRAEIKNYGAE